MRNTRPFLAAAAILASSALLVSGCASTPDPAATTEPTTSGGPITVTDLLGRQVEIAETPETLIAAGGGALRLATYMNLVDQVVGVEDTEQTEMLTRPYSYVHTDTFQALPVIGQGGAGGSVPNVESILSVNPDVIVARWDQAMADEIQTTTGIPVIVVGYDGIFDDTLYDSLDLIGEIFNAEERADELTSAMKDMQADLEGRTADVSEAERPTAYTGGVNYKGKQGFAGTYAHYMPFDAVGAVNVADETGQNAQIQVDVEKVLEWDPEYIFLNPENLSMYNEDYAARPDVYDSLKAVQNGRVYSQISYVNYYENIEIALADAYDTGVILFPKQFSDIDSAEKFDEIMELFLGVPLYDGFEAQGSGFGPLKIG